MRLDDPALVERQYETEQGLRARKAIYDESAGVDARDVAFDAVSEAAPRAVLEVGCGEGELAARIRAELGVEVVALDQSARMVELSRERGVDARVGDVQELPFEDGSFDVAVAAWMLFHVADLDRGLRELARVLRPGGRLVAVTNHDDHLIELFDLVGAERFELTFGGENGAVWLEPHFDRVERRDAEGTVTLRDAELIRSYLRSSERLAPHAEGVPELVEPLVARRRQAVFVAEKAPVIRAADLIEKKRDGEEHSPEEISALIEGYNTGSVPDYQMAAWCMAVFFRGLSGRETYALTDAFIRSGDALDLGSMLGRRVVDKHSTGGVGDKTSIAVGPIIAACGVPFGKMSGRGLGHTGGTLDKLESIPGFRVELTTDEFVAQVRDVGLAIIGTTENLVPADKNLYGLRDVTATVDIVPLIASSIMSKKIAAGADAIVLDVKVGDGAFMKTLDDARILADQMVDLGSRAGREVVCLLTDMEQPLGYAVGNALEIREAIATITGDGPPDFTELVLDACAHLLSLSDLELDVDEGRRRAQEAMKNGSALEAYERWIRAQGGDPDLSRLDTAPVVKEVTAPRGGVVTGLGALAVGVAALELGAGRRTKEDAIDHAVGVLLRAKRDDEVEAGDVLAEIHARDDASADRAVDAVLAAYEIGDPGASRPRGILLDVVE